LPIKFKARRTSSRVGLFHFQTFSPDQLLPIRRKEVSLVARRLLAQIMDASAIDILSRSR